VEGTENLLKILCGVFSQRKKMEEKTTEILLILQEIVDVVKKTNECVNLLLHRLDPPPTISEERSGDQTEVIFYEIDMKLTSKVIDDYFDRQYEIFRKKPLNLILGSKKDVEGDFPYKKERKILFDVFDKIIQYFYNPDLLLETNTPETLKKSVLLSNSIKLTCLKIVALLQPYEVIHNDEATIHTQFQKKFYNAIYYRGKLLIHHHLTSTS
jgi:hypothetical protein